MAVFRLPVSSKTSILEEQLVSFTDLHTPMYPSIVSSGLRDFRQPISGQAGRSFPLGASVFADGANFSVFSRHATRVDLLLFDDVAATRPARVIELDARTHRTYHYWHVFVPGIGTGQVYAYRSTRHWKRPTTSWKPRRHPRCWEHSTAWRRAP